MHLQSSNIEKKVSNLTALYIDDDIHVLKETKHMLSDILKSIDIISDPTEAINLYKANPNSYDIIITDIRMPRIDGLSLIKMIKDINKNQEILILSALNEPSYFIEAINLRIGGYVLKPIDFKCLMNSFVNIAENIELKQKNIEYNQFLQEKISQKKQLLEESIFLDKTTNLPNNTALNHELEFLENTQRKCTLIILNIDNYLHINHLLGYKKSEEVLKTVSNLLSSYMLKNSKIYKYDLDKFAILSENSSQEEIENFATFLLAFFKETPIMEHDNLSIYVLFSMGICINTSAYVAISRAKVTLMESKSLGSVGRYSIYTPHDALMQKEFENETWMCKIRDAIEKNKIIAFFQPIVDLNTNKIVKYEALARIEEDGKIISPDKFLDAIKNSGLNSNLTRVMIWKTFDKFQKSSFTISLNITFDDIIDSIFIDFLIVKCKTYDINPTRVVLEILESSILDFSSPIIINHINILKSYGFRISLDDFGCEYSNIDRLRLIDFDFVKIDGSFIKNIDKTPKNYEIVKYITDMLKMMNIPIITEFVSNEKEFELIKNLGIEYAQGNYLYPASTTIHN